MDKAVTLLLTWFGLVVCAQLAHLGHAQTFADITDQYAGEENGTDSRNLSVNGTENEAPTRAEATAAMTAALRPTTPNATDPHLDPSSVESDTVSLNDTAESPLVTVTNATDVETCADVICMPTCKPVLNERGCPVCKCSTKPHLSCKGTGCRENTVCHDNGNTSVCKAMPLCVRHRTMLLQDLKSIKTFPMLIEGSPEGATDGLAGLRYIPTCEEDGSFAPRQCQKNSTDAAEVYDCWCVDDRGIEISGSRQVVENRNQTICDRKKTQILDVFFKMMHTFEKLEEEMEEFQEILRQQLSEWTTMDYENIEDLHIRANSVNRVVIEFTIFQRDGSDLASVAFHFMHSVRYSKLKMQYKGTAFTPLPESVKVTHHYENGAPRISVCYGPNHYQRKSIVHIVAAMVCGSAVLLLGVFFIIVMARKRRSTTADDKEAFFGRNLFYTNMPSLIPNEDEKKEAVA